MNDNSPSDLDNPFAHLAHLPRPERRRQMRAEMKAKQQSLKHQVRVPEEGEYDGMHPDTAADCLTDVTMKNSNTFRKVCKKARERLHIPTATPKPGKIVRKISEMNFGQLGRSFRRSYAKRFHHIPKLFKRIKGTDENAEKARQVLTMAIHAHDQNIVNVNTEIIKRVGPRNVAQQEARVF